jgi:hypothetical protein
MVLGWGKEYSLVTKASKGVRVEPIPKVEKVLSYLLFLVPRVG